MATKPQLKLQLSPLTGEGFPTRDDKVFRSLLQQATSGGAGTANYLGHMQKFADFASYLNRVGDAAFTYEEGPKGSHQSRATDGVTTLRINVQLHEEARLQETFQAAKTAPQQGPLVFGVATVSLRLPSPESIDKIVNLAIGLAEIPAGIAVGKALLDVLIKPLVQKISRFLKSALDKWADTELGDDLDAAGEALEEGASEAAEEIGEEAVEVAVEEVAAEVVLDLAAAVPPLAILGALIAIPLLIRFLEKKFILHLEVDNLTDYDLDWSIPYMDEGTMTAQPKAKRIPKVGKARDVWGDETNVPVVYQGNYASMNKSGFSGIGLLLHLRPQSAGAETEVAAVISIPWSADNTLWLGDVPAHPDWRAIYQQGAGAESRLAVQHSNAQFNVELAINALVGHHDEYSCILKIEAF